MTSWRQKIRFIAAGSFFISAFSAVPLAFLRLTGEKVPLYGLVYAGSFPVLALLSLAVIAAFPERLRNLPFSRSLYWVYGAVGLFVLTGSFHLFAGNSSPENFLGAAGIPLALLAAAMLADELRKMLPYLASAAAILLIISGLTSENFTGLTGNWNWTQGLIAALLPGIAFFFPEKIRIWVAMPVVTLFFLLIILFFPEGFSRAALAAMGVAAVVLYLRYHTLHKYFRLILPAGGVVLIAGLSYALAVMDLPDTRFQIMKGALNCIASSPLAGVGPGNFSGVIRHFLCESYFFTPYPSVHIDHAHNDLLHLTVENGISGLLLYASGIWLVLRRRKKLWISIFSQWIFLVMLTCGFFDQHNFILAGGTILLIAAGVSMMPERMSEIRLPERRIWQISGIAAGVVFLAAAGWLMTVNVRSSSLYRESEAALLRRDYPAALDAGVRSVEIKSNLPALALAAELSLAGGEAGKALEFIRKMEEFHKNGDYRHIQRVKAIAAFQQKDHRTAMAAMDRELTTSPFSVISQRYYIAMLEGVPQSDPAEKQAAFEKFLLLCSWRKVAPENSIRITPETDDGAFPADVRKKMFPAETVSLF